MASFAQRLSIAARKFVTASETNWAPVNPPEPALQVWSLSRVAASDRHALTLSIRP
jgi:hypothetical protein